jgi:hypothetical protein
MPGELEPSCWTSFQARQRWNAYTRQHHDQ